jgi:hypothetical protein
MARMHIGPTDLMVILTLIHHTHIIPVNMTFLKRLITMHVRKCKPPKISHVSRCDMNVINECEK